MSDPVVAARPPLEVADVIRSHGEAFLAKYGKHLSATQKKALRDLASCRTALLGGHVQRCLDCGHDRIAYNSCRNRHCPKCQALSRARWLERESAYLLPVEYHHVVFTLPAELAELAARNASALYTLLMQSAAETLREVAANPKRLGAQVGVLMVLHTYAKAPFGGPELVLKYLARYTHRVAISNHRLVKLEAGRVTFRYKDYADSRKEKLLTLSAEEFTRAR